MNLLKSVVILTNPRGEHNPLVAYAKMDEVQHETSLYVASESMPAGVPITDPRWVRKIDNSAAYQAEQERLAAEQNRDDAERDREAAEQNRETASGTAVSNANAATSAANTAAGAANTAAGAANSAATAATSAAEVANTAASNADTKAGLANTAASAANTAATKLSAVEAEITMTAPNTDPVASVEQTSSKTTFSFYMPWARVAYPAFAVDPDTHHLTMELPDEFGANFQINNGHLEVVV